MSKHNGKKKKHIRYYSPKRRKIYSQGDDITPIVLFELHAWTCWVCKEPINRYLRVPNYKAATIEHIVPISRGGTHTWENTAPAHYGCNMSKGDSLIDEFQDIIAV